MRIRWSFFAAVPSLTCLLWAVGLGFASPAHAGGRDLVVSTTRLGGDAETAQPYIDKFSAYLEKTAGWPAGSLKGRFAPSRKELLSAVDTQKPGIGVFDPWIYFELRAAHKLEPIAQVDSADLNSPRLNVVVKDPAIKNLDELKGKRLWTNLAESPRYLSQVVLDGQGAAETRFTLKQVGNAMKAARAVLRGEADAAVLDDEQLAAAKKLDGGAALRVVYTSPPQPPVVVALFGDSASKADKPALTKALLSLCAAKEGQEICTEMHISKFVPLDTALFSAAQKRYEAPGGAKK